MNCDTVELLPNPAFLMQSMRHIGYTLETALADLLTTLLQQRPR